MNVKHWIQNEKSGLVNSNLMILHSYGSLYRFFFKIEAKIIYCWEEKKLKPQVIWKKCEPINYLCLDRFAVKYN